MFRSGVSAFLLLGLLTTGTSAAAAPTRTETREYVDVGGDFGVNDSCVNDSVPGIGGVCFAIYKADRIIRVRVADISTLWPCAVLNFHAADGRVLPPHNYLFVDQSANLAVPKGAASVTIGVLQLSSAVFCGSSTGPGTAGIITTQFSTKR